MRFNADSAKKCGKGFLRLADFPHATFKWIAAFVMLPLRSNYANACC